MKLLLAIVLAFALIAPASAMAGTVTLGTLSLVTATPTYGQPVTLTWTLPKRPQMPTLGVFCVQSNALVYIAELPVPRALTGTGSVPLTAEASSAIPGTLTDAPASCTGWVWDEYHGAREPAGLTNTVSFEMAP